MNVWKNGHLRIECHCKSSKLTRVLLYLVPRIIKPGCLDVIKDAVDKAVDAVKESALPPMPVTVAATSGWGLEPSLPSWLSASLEASSPGSAEPASCVRPSPQASASSVPTVQVSWTKLYLLHIWNSTTQAPVFTGSEASWHNARADTTCAKLKNCTDAPYLRYIILSCTADNLSQKLLQQVTLGVAVFSDSWGDFRFASKWALLWLNIDILKGCPVSAMLWILHQWQWAPLITSNLKGVTFLLIWYCWLGWIVRSNIEACC